ncbi:MAG: class II fructose-bisphosphate aldolase [Caldilineales bacterium]|nr:class II fructose-bisphosphate aldolase [Caldilineales bacterium]MCW5858510.1 class II fructose-bisphosphate aldolase [Caldilineales bacterium]
MSLIPFPDLMAEAERGHYAVGYFESWNLESLLAVADAAEALRSPVILGFSGITIPHPQRLVRDRLAPYAALGLEVARSLTVPCCLLFNESPHLDWVFESIDLGFNLTMFSDEEMSAAEQAAIARQVAARAHPAGVAVEAEMSSLVGLSGDVATIPSDLHLTDPAAAAAFVAETGIDALAVNIGQVHLHGRRQVRLDFARLAALRQAVPVPLVLHGATSVARDDLAAAARVGIGKINVGSAIKRAFFEATRRACLAAGESYNPYDVLGSGFAADVLVAGRLAMQAVVEDLMRLFGSAGKA